MNTKMAYVYTPTKPRGPVAAMYTSPGPCYALPNLTGGVGHDPRSSQRKHPAYSFGLKHGNFSSDCSPGPCYLPDSKVSRSGRDGTPHFSLYSRHREATKLTTPGPGSYRPETAGPSSKISYPAYSLGSRLKLRKMDNSPGANSYMLPSTIGKTVQSGKRQAPCFSLPGRPKTGTFSEDMCRTPGPGAYASTDPSTNKSRAPLFSMTGRNMMPSDNTQKPGPGTHSPQNSWLHKKKYPEISFGIRHSQYTAPLIIDVKD